MPGFVITILARSSKAAAPKKPISGDVTSATTVSSTLPQFTPSPKPSPAISEFISPTPTIEPIRVCELEAGRPRYHVPTFQMMADSSKENTIANPAPEPTLITNSTGSSATIPKATAPEDVSTPIRFHMPDQTTA